MKILRILLIGLLGLGVTAVALAFTGHKQVHAELIIQAQPWAIWALISDAPKYQEWNPVFVEVQGEYRQGAELTYQMKDQSGKTTAVKAKVVKLDPEKELNQFGGMRGLMTFDHHWLLEPVEGGTKVTQHEEYRGLMVWFWNPSWFETAYAKALEALRDRVLANQGAGQPGDGGQG